MTQSIQKDALLAQFAELAYKSRDYLRNPANLPAGWAFVTDKVDGPFAAFAFRNSATGEVIVSYRGTDGLSDIPADARIATASWNSQFRQGMHFVTQLRGTGEIPTDPTKVLGLLGTAVLDSSGAKPLNWPLACHRASNSMSKSIAGETEFGAMPR